MNHRTRTKTTIRMLKPSPILLFLAGAINCVIIALLGWILLFVAGLFIVDRRLFPYIDKELFFSFLMFSIIICGIYAVLAVFVFKPFGTKILLKAILTGSVGTLSILFWKYAVSGEITIAGPQEFSFFFIIFIMGFLLPYFQRRLTKLLKN